jgi:hypothetical protein
MMHSALWRKDGMDIDALVFQWNKFPHPDSEEEDNPVSVRFFHKYEDNPWEASAFINRSVPPIPIHGDQLNRSQARILWDSLSSHGWKAKHDIKVLDDLECELEIEEQMSGLKQVLRDVSEDH